jgi:hypothetical protein
MPPLALDVPSHRTDGAASSPRVDVRGARSLWREHRRFPARYRNQRCPAPFLVDRHEHVPLRSIRSPTARSSRSPVAVSLRHRRAVETARKREDDVVAIRAARERAHPASSHPVTGAHRRVAWIVPTSPQGGVVPWHAPASEVADRIRWRSLRQTARAQRDALKSAEDVALEVGILHVFARG